MHVSELTQPTFKRNRVLAGYGRAAWYARGSGFGAAPEGHDRRCKGISRSTLSQCKRFSIRGNDYCLMHSVRQAVAGRQRPQVMSKYYGKYLNARLADVVAEHSKKSIAQLAQLTEELAMVRDVAGQAVQLYSAVDLLPEATDKERDIKARAKLTCGCVMQEQLLSVAEFCERAIKIDNMAKDKLGAHNVTIIAEQIASFAHECFADLPDQTPVHKFAKMLEDCVRVNVEKPGTTLTPDADVTAMDGTVPSG